MHASRSGVRHTKVRVRVQKRELADTMYSQFVLSDVRPSPPFGGMTFDSTGGLIFIDYIRTCSHILCRPLEVLCCEVM